MKELRDVLDGIKPLEQNVLDEAKRKIDNLTKPPGSLGRLEEIARRYVGIRGSVTATVGKKCIFVFAADHGVTEEGVSAYPRSVTPQMVYNMLNGGAAVSVLSRHVGSECVVVDIGVDHDFEPAKGLIIDKVARGTRNFAAGPAMSREEALQAVKTGIDVAMGYARRGFTLFGTGEMGIGNTTASSAILSVMGNLPPEKVVGRGTGVDDAGLLRKAEVIDRAIVRNGPDIRDPIGVLATVGGLEIGGIAGLVIGGAARRIPVVVDGFISTAGALIATALKPAISDYLFYSHLSAETGHAAMLDMLGQTPLLALGMRLGEGTGAALAMSLIEGAVKTMHGMATFEAAAVDKAIEE